MDFKNWDPVIGLEIHAQLKTQSKMFSSDGACFEEQENSQIHPVSLGLPGALPVLNKEAFYLALKTARAFSGEIKNHSVFARKNYFYPDLPKGYQISQYDKPFCKGGEVKFFFNGELQKVSLERIHMEEDAGRSLHKEASTLLNFNRAGVPLLEIVTKPEMKDPAAVAACAKAIRQVLRYLEVCDGNLEEGSLRCDCNVSIRLKGERKLGTKVELKNINSFRFIEKALLYEIKRQIRCLESGESLTQETRLYDSTRNQTRSMRSKEEASDYRYFPDPDLPLLSFEDSLLQKIVLPELPLTKRRRFRENYGLKEEIIGILIEEPLLADYFENIVEKTKEPESTAYWLTGEFQARFKESSFSLEDCPISVQNFADLILFVTREEISLKIAKEVFSLMWEKGKSPKTIIEQKNFKQISDTKILEEIVEKTLNQYPKQRKDYKEGRTKLFGFFVGQVMKETKGQAHPQKLSTLLKQKLDE